MIGSLVSPLAATDPSPPPLSLQPSKDEKVAGHALDDQMACLPTGVFDRRNDLRPAAGIPADNARECSDRATSFRNALRDVDRRKPVLRSAGVTREETTSADVAELNSRVVLVIKESRKNK